MMTYSTPISVSISAEISPVKAPDFSKWQFCAPTLMLEPFAASSTVSRLVKGTQATTSQPASATMGFMASMSSLASGRVLFIFQLPAITALRTALFMSISPSDTDSKTAGACKDSRRFVCYRSLTRTDRREEMRAD